MENYELEGFWDIFFCIVEIVHLEKSDEGCSELKEKNRKNETKETLINVVTTGRDYR